MNFTFRFRPATTAPANVTVRHGAHETLVEARRFAQGYARRLSPGAETVLIESDDGMIRERWIWLGGVWERDELV